MKSYKEDDDRLHMLGSPLRVDELPTPGELARIALHFLPLHAVEKDPSRAMIQATKLAVQLWGASKDALLNAASISRDYWQREDSVRPLFCEERIKSMEILGVSDSLEGSMSWTDAAARLFPSESIKTATDRLMGLAKKQGEMHRLSKTKQNEKGQVTVELGSSPFSFEPAEMVSAMTLTNIITTYLWEEAKKKKAEDDRRRREREKAKLANLNPVKGGKRSGEARRKKAAERDSAEVTKATKAKAK